MFAPAAPAPFTMILAVAKSFLTKRRAPFTPAKHAIAVPCWSSWNTGNFQFFFQTIFDIVAFRRRNIFQVNTSKVFLQQFYSVD